MRWRPLTSIYRFSAIRNSSRIRPNSFHSAPSSSVRYLTATTAAAAESSRFPSRSAIAAWIAATTATGAIITTRDHALCDAGDTIEIESETGVSYPRRLDGGYRLVGTSARLMGGIVQVYSVGVYVRSDGIDGIRSPEGPLEAPDGEKFWDDVFANQHLLLRLVVVRQVNGTHMASGFERGLSKVVSAKRPTTAMKRFGALFKKLGNMKVGSEMLITCDPASGTVHLVVDGREIGTVHDPTLTNALPLMYLGEKSVTPGLRANTAQGFCDYL